LSVFNNILKGFEEGWFGIEQRFSFDVRKQY
jgi:hypothetical protein